MPWGQEKPDLVWINLDYIILRNQKPKKNKKNKETKQQRNQKNGKKTMFSRLVWTCLDPSSPPNIVFLFYFGWLTTVSSISTRKGLCMDSTRHKANIVLDNVMYLGKKCLLRAHNKPFCISNRKALCMDNKKQYYFRSCNILTKNWIYTYNWWFQRWQQTFL